MRPAGCPEYFRIPESQGVLMAGAVVDARGQLCPKPLILTKKALLALPVGDQMTVLIDNATSLENVSRFLSDNGVPFSVTRDGEVSTMTVTKQALALSSPDAAGYCTTASRAGHVVCLRGDTMGSGNPDLGGVLMKACINTLENVTPLPSAVVCYNHGVRLALRDSPVLEALTELSRKGVRILVCGTCLDYLKQKENLAVGTVSNMYDILDALTSAGHVLYP